MLHSVKIYATRSNTYIIYPLINLIHQTRRVRRVCIIKNMQFSQKTSYIESVYRSHRNLARSDHEQPYQALC